LRKNPTKPAITFAPNLADIVALIVVKKKLDGLAGILVNVLV